MSSETEKMVLMNFNLKPSFNTEFKIEAVTLGTTMSRLLTKMTQDFIDARKTATHDNPLTIIGTANSTKVCQFRVSEHTRNTIKDISRRDGVNMTVVFESLWNHYKQQK